MRPRSLLRSCLLIAGLLFAALPGGATELQPTTDWEGRNFKSGTLFADTIYDGQPALSVIANNAGAIKGARVRLPLAATPYVDFLWAAQSDLGGNDERVKAGDDYVARVMFAFMDSDRRMAGISYVWSAAAPVGTWIESPFSGALNLVVQTGPARSDGFTLIERNLLEDARNGLGMRNPVLINVAIMSDTDQTGASTRAWYGRIRFKGQPATPAPRPLDGPKIS